MLAIGGPKAGKDDGTLGLAGSGYRVRSFADMRSGSRRQAFVHDAVSDAEAERIVIETFSRSGSAGEGSDTAAKLDEATKSRLNTDGQGGR